MFSFFIPSAFLARIHRVSFLDLDESFPKIGGVIAKRIALPLPMDSARRSPSAHENKDISNALDKYSYPDSIR